MAEPINTLDSANYFISFISTADSAIPVDTHLKKKRNCDDRHAFCIRTHTLETYTREYSQHLNREKQLMKQIYFLLIVFVFPCFIFSSNKSSKPLYSISLYPARFPRARCAWEWSTGAYVNYLFVGQPMMMGCESLADVWCSIYILMHPLSISVVRSSTLFTHSISIFYTCLANKIHSFVPICLHWYESIQKICTVFTLLLQCIQLYITFIY